MRGSLKIGVIAGIGIYLHWTFAILIGWLFLSGLIQGQSPAEILPHVAFTLALFACVLLHELGHALAARRYNIQTRDITLLPIGGLARLERIPEKPLHELWVAVAGPLVNVVIAAMLALVLSLQTGALPPIAEQLSTSSFWARLMLVNVFIVGFNLLPAFPMDGGRILRALLAAWIGRRRATAIAAGIGQVMAVLFGIMGFLYSPLLVFIAILVYIGAQSEADLVETTSLIQGLRVKDAMMTRFRTLEPDDPVHKAIEELLAGSQQDFPVVSTGSIQGLLRRQDLIRGIAAGRSDQMVKELASADCSSVQAEAPLEGVLERMRGEGCKTLPVLEDTRLVGLLTVENISELVMVRAALSGKTRPGHNQV
jgi:Zn-dependent protease